MDPRIKALWIGRLRSPDVEEQGSNQLGYRVGGVEMRCCLGVLCDIAVEEGVIGRKEVSDPQGDFVSYMYGDTDDPDAPTDIRQGFNYTLAQHYLPVQVRTWAGFDSSEYAPEVETPEGVTGRSDTVQLSALNDSHDLPFGKIADAIERSL